MILSLLYGWTTWGTKNRLRSKTWPSHPGLESVQKASNNHQVLFFDIRLWGPVEPCQRVEYWTSRRNVLQILVPCKLPYPTEMGGLFQERVCWASLQIRLHRYWCWWQRATLSATPLLAFLGSAPAKTGSWRSLARTGVLWAEAPHGWQPRWMDAASSSSLAKHSGLEKGHNLMLWCRTQGLWGSKTLKILEFIFHESSPFLVPFSLCRPFLFLFFFFGLLFVEFKNKSSNNKRATNSWKRRCQ